LITPVVCAGVSFCAARLAARSKRSCAAGDIFFVLHLWLWW
jgi:hypothetical protein